VKTVGMECGRNPVYFIWEAFRQPDLEGTVNLVDIMWSYFCRQLVSAPECLVNVKNDIVRFLRLRLRFPRCATLCLASSSGGWGRGLLLYCLTFLCPNLYIVGQSGGCHLQQHPISFSSESGNSPLSNTIPTVFSLSPQIASLHLS
jgi:hypothetical protein